MILTLRRFLTWCWGHKRVISSYAFLVTLGLAVYIQVSIFAHQDGVYATVDETPKAPVALVFGAGVKRDGTPTDALRDRVLTGVELYKAGKVRKIVMTGDNGTRYHNEVTPMIALAIAEGVPREDVVGDYAGFRTYESCYRARDVFGLYEVIAVSQAFHLPRILYICGSMNIHTVGLVADRGTYREAERWEVREFFARLKAWWQVEITKPLPRYLGPVEKIF